MGCNGDGDVLHPDSVTRALAHAMNEHLAEIGMHAARLCQLLPIGSQLTLAVEFGEPHARIITPDGESKGDVGEMITIIRPLAGVSTKIALKAR